MGTACDRVAIAPRDECGASWRAQRRCAKHVVGVGEPLKVRRLDRTAEGGRVTEPYVISHDEENVGRPLRGFDAPGKVWLRLLGRATDPSLEGRIRPGQGV